MTAIWSFVLATLTLLAVPGPTNTLLAASGAAVGFRRSLRLLPFELAGYSLAIGALTLALGRTVAAVPSVGIAARVIASAYLVWSAITLWRRSQRLSLQGATVVSPTRVFITTLLNPKALIFAFVIMPAGEPEELAPYVFAFWLLVPACACAWIAAGALLAGPDVDAITPARIAKVAAAALLLFAAAIGGSAIASALR